MTNPSSVEVLNCPMGPNSAKAATVGDYFLALGRKVWNEGESFSGKRPFGSDDWRFDVIDALLSAGLASSARQAVVLVNRALLPVVDDPDLPRSLQGRTAPSWWNQTEDPFEDPFIVPGYSNTPLMKERPERCCSPGSCGCRIPQ